MLKLHRSRNKCSTGVLGAYATSVTVPYHRIDETDRQAAVTFAVEIPAPKLSYRCSASFVKVPWGVTRAYKFI